MRLCKLGIHDLGSRLVGPCKRCSYVRQSVVTNAGWIRHTGKPDESKRPLGLPPK